MKIRRALPDDCFELVRLYHEVYGGTYPDPLMRDLGLMQSFLASQDNLWLAAEEEGKIVGSVVFMYDRRNYLAKVFGAAVSPKYRGRSTAEQLTAEGMELLGRQVDRLDVVYVTARTIHDKAQLILERLGFKKIGIFPNAHKTAGYETHCLGAWFSPTAIKLRHQAFKIHHKVKPLADLVAREVGFQPLDIIVPDTTSRLLVDPPELELITARRFAERRRAVLVRGDDLLFRFFPFQKADALILSPDQEVEVFLSLAQKDGHCEILGGRLGTNIRYATLLQGVVTLLRDVGVRYVEIIVPARHPKIVESILQAKFIPSAYFPALQLKDGMRHDYIVFSRTFEILDFEDLHFRGAYGEFLALYYKMWKELSLTPSLQKL